MSQWYAKSSEATIRELETKINGLSHEVAAKRLKLYGPNELPEQPQPGVFVIFFRQFKSPLIYLLLAAAVVMYFLHDGTDSIIILVVLIFNAIIGAFQEGKAQNTLKALKHFAQTQAVVKREGIDIGINDTEVVPGDILILREGNKTPADARIISSSGLTVDEASMTGESLPVYKQSEIIKTIDASVAEQKNMVFKGTNVVAGSAIAIVTSTGAETIIGSISLSLEQIKDSDPLKKQIAFLSRGIIFAVIIMAILFFIIGYLQSRDLFEIGLTVISLAVSVIPEGLPIVLTLILATGVLQMGKRNALVKKLQAVENLGQAEIIAVDKTGTITKNEMVVQQALINSTHYTFEGLGYEPTGEVRRSGTLVASSLPDLQILAEVSAFCADATVSFKEKEKMWEVHGDPTEAALLVLAEKLGIRKDEIELKHRLLAELPFSYKSKYHATLHAYGEKNVLVSIGAPEVILGQCNNVYEGHDKENPITPEIKKRILNDIEKLSAQGLRILGIARSETTHHAINIEQIHKLNFIGLVGIRDTLRPEVHEALRKAQGAGLKVVMITGDHAITAQAIATEAGIFKDGDTVITGHDLDTLPADSLAMKIKTTSVFARVTPNHKLKIIEAYKKSGMIIAMTGDGVNDAPSLVAADLGVAMGKVGTEVAKEAADIILLDDNFGTIVAAIEEGRHIYKTIKKVVLYLFSTGAGEALTIFGAVALGMPLPVLASQIIWLNFVTDGFLTVALGFEPKEDQLLNHKAGKQDHKLIDGAGVKRMILMALPMSVGTLIVFSHYMDLNMTKALTMSLTTLAIFQWFNAWNCRHETESIFNKNIFSNIPLVASLAIVIILQILAVYTPLLQKLLHTTPLSLNEWLICITMSLTVIVVEEIRKLIARYKTAQ